MTSTFQDTLTDNDRALLIKLADKIIKLRMTTPAVLFLESVRPMNYVGSQVMVFFAPMVGIFFQLTEWDRLTRIMEQRESIAYFLDLIEERESDHLIELDRIKAERKANKPERRWKLFHRRKRGSSS